MGQLLSGVTVLVARSNLSKFLAVKLSARLYESETWPCLDNIPYAILGPIVIQAHSSVPYDFQLTKRTLVRYPSSIGVLFLGSFG